MAEGFYREAISSFAVALERFYEYFVHIVAIKNSLYHEFDKTLKIVSRQSQVELGAYFMTHLMEFKNTAPTLSKKYIELRNKVIHKGYMSNQSECEEFAINAAKIIALGTSKLNSNCLDAIQSYEERNYHIRDISEIDLLLDYLCFSASSVDKIECELKDYVDKLSKKTKATTTEP